VSGRIRTLAVALALVGAATIGLAAPGRAQPRLPVRVETLVAPDTLRLGGPVTLTWRVWLPKGSVATFPPRPADDSLYHWTDWSTTTRDLKGEYREHRLTGRFQSFALGTVEVPGPPLRFTIPGEEARDGRFPVARFVVVPVVPEGGEDPPLRDLHGLVPPPWWATWPWLWIAAGVALAALVAFAVWRWRQRRRVAAPVAAAPGAPLEAPELEARRRLAALRARALPEAGRTYEHGTELADLLRRYVERRFGSPQPGYTTGELARHLAERGDVRPDDVATLRGLLEACDLTKFARRPYDAPRAHEAEIAAAGLIDAWAAPRQEAA
jgi:hypothetical protein